MASDGGWAVRVDLGTELVIFGRVRNEHGNTMEGDGRSKRDHEREHDWLASFRQHAIANGGTFNMTQVEVSRRSPDREEGRLARGRVGYWGGTEVQIAHYAVAAWGAVGGVAGIMGFLQLIKTIKSLWSREQSIEVTLADGTKVRVSSERDVDLALKTIRKLKRAAGHS